MIVNKCKSQTNFYDRLLNEINAAISFTKARLPSVSLKIWFSLQESELDGIVDDHILKPSIPTRFSSYL